jgi:hypothetical protein
MSNLYSKRKLDVWYIRHCIICSVITGVIFPLRSEIMKLSCLAAVKVFAVPVLGMNDSLPRTAALSSFE